MVALLAGVAVVSPDIAHTQSGVVYPLDGFENGIRVVQPQTGDANKYLWNLWSGAGAGPTSITNDAYSGNSALQSVFQSGTNWQFQFYTYTENLSGWSNDWQFAKKFVANPGSWANNRVNRLRFWVKLPAGTAEEGGGSHNFEFGTYIRCSTCGGAEDGGGHYYHFYDLNYTGQWHQIIVDTHPNHSRGDIGDAERGDRLHPTGEGGYTYFDLMTRFYLDFPYATFPMPATFKLDNFEFYEETRPENVDQVYALNAVYIPSSNKVVVGWQRRKDQTVAHDVRYAFSDIFSIGWNAATPAPGGTGVTPAGSGGEASMRWSTTGISTSGRTMLYVAIKPQNASTFRQISIPLSGTGSTPTLPSAPQHLRIVP